MPRLARISLLTGCIFALGNSLFAATSGGTCPTSVPTGISNCYYADFVTGVDTNAGTSEAAPLQHLPGMVGCASNCAAITPAAGEGFILKGGVTWTKAALRWSWNWSGTGTTSSPGCTGSGCIYVGVDPSWYSGSSWARPILNAGGVAITPNNNILGIGEPGNYLIFDNIEFTGFYWSGSPAYGSANIGLPGGEPGIGTNDTFEHLYIHGWSHDTLANGTSDDACGIDGDTSDPNSNANTILEYSVISGADTDRASCNGAVFGGPPYIAYNVLEYVASAMVIDSPVTVHDNLIQNVVSSFNTSTHENALEENFSQNTTVYNNVFRHIGSGALTLWLAPDSGHTAYVFNNVIYDTDVGNVLDFAASLKTTPSGTIVFWNNTVECGQDSNPNAVCAGPSSSITAVTLQNNHFITNAGSYWPTISVPLTQANNVLQTKATANGQGYTSSQTYAFSPTAAYSTNATPGQGTSAASLCAASGVSACSNDTTYGVAYNTTNHTVSSPGRTTSSAWSNPPDVGAYSFAAGKQPGVPQGVTGNVVTVP
jgi:hypothetical protein